MPWKIRLCPVFLKPSWQGLVTAETFPCRDSDHCVPRITPCSRIPWLAEVCKVGCFRPNGAIRGTRQARIMSFTFRQLMESDKYFPNWVELPSTNALGMDRVLRLADSYPGFESNFERKGSGPIGFLG
jgi:hypothetical protein